MEQLKVMLVDDEEDLVSALAERLRLRGFQVETATTGSDALTHVSAGDFSVVILDVKMPGIGGVELMVEIMRRQPDLPVIMFTGHGSVADARKGMEQGAFDYVMKPIDIDDLIQKIGNAAGRKTG